jgi:TatD DNase family protein
MLTDTHCHIHEHDYADPDGARQRAIAADVSTLLCVGVNEDSSRRAVQFAQQYQECKAIIGVHPHHTKEGIYDIERLLNDSRESIHGIGEIGLDYFYTHSPKDVQVAALEQQLQWALDFNLPVSFHVREAFDDFWPVFDAFSGIRGVLHSFTDTAEQLEKGLTRGLYIGVNGISTFTKDKKQQSMFASIPLDRMLLETDAPFLTPVPKRGTVNEPAFVRYVAEHHATLRGVSAHALAEQTTANASALFTL